MPTIGERMAALEQGGRDRDRRLEAIERGLTELIGVMRLAHGAVERLNAQFAGQMQSNHQANQAAIAAIAADVAELKPIVTEHETERQRAKGAKTLIAAIAAAIGGAAGGLAGWFK